MKTYLELMKNIKENGRYSMDRTGVGRHRIFGTQTRFDMSNGTLPVVTTRKIFLNGIIKELLWFISGSHNANDLAANGVKIWDNWKFTEEHAKVIGEKYAVKAEATPEQLTQYFKEKHEGSIGPMYGAMWRNAPRTGIHKFWPDVDMADIPSDKLADFKKQYDAYCEADITQPTVSFEEFCKYGYYGTVDQLAELMNNLRKRPYSSRLVVNAWIPDFIPFEELSPQENVALDRGSLAPCHVMFQCFATPPEVEGGKPRLSLMMTQRSVDFAVGAAFNIAQYSLLLALIAHCADMEPGEFIWSTGDTHLYSDQMPLIDEQLSREPLPAPKLWLNPEKKDLFAFTFDDIRIQDYQSHPHIPYPVAT